MKLIWSLQAKKALEDTASYIQDEFGRRVKRDFALEVRRIARLLRKNPKLGPPEPWLEGASVTYRSIVVNRLNKMVYYIHDDVIEVVAFWDTRREPKEQAGQVE